MGGGEHLGLTNLISYQRYYFCCHTLKIYTLTKIMIKIIPLRIPQIGVFKKKHICVLFKAAHNYLSVLELSINLNSREEK